MDKRSSADIGEARCAKCSAPLHSDDPQPGDWCMDCNMADTPAVNDLCNKGKRIRAAAQQVPEGYALVPLKPTPEMIEVGCEHNPTQWADETPDSFAADVANDVYTSMVRSALLLTKRGT